jgi:rhamnosyltransferase
MSRLESCSIIIRACNEERHIGKLIAGIKHQKIERTIEVILVDSGSTDSTVDIALAMGAKVVKISKDDFTFGKSLNVGCEAASGQILLIASAHVYPLFTNWIHKMVEPFDDPSVGLVYGKQVGNENTKFSEKRIFQKWFPNVSIKEQINPFCNNANAAIRKSLWVTQKYNEELTGLEDIEWATRIQKMGYNLSYLSEAVIVHVHEETPKKIYNRYKREAIAMKKIMPSAHFSFFNFISLLILNIISDFYFAFLENNFLRNFIDILVFRYMQFWGTYRGFNNKEVLSEELKRRFYYPNPFLPNYNDSNVKDSLIDYTVSPNQ